MDRWQALMPDKAVAMTATRHAARLPRPPRLIGRLPAEAYVVVLAYLPVPDIPAFALASRQLASITRDDRLWRAKLAWLDYRGPGAIQWRSKQPNGAKVAQEERRPNVPIPPPPLVDTMPDIGFADDDGFGDFQDGEFDSVEDEFGAMQVSNPANAQPPTKATEDLMMLFEDDAESPAPTLPKPQVSKPKPRPASTTIPPTPDPLPSMNGVDMPLRDIFIKHHSLLLPFYMSLLTHTTSSLIFTTASLTSQARSLLLSALVRFCDPLVAPTRSLPQRQTVLRNVQSAIDFFESALIAEFERAEHRDDEETMKERASILWQLNGNKGSLVQIFVQKREIFYEQMHAPLKNLTKVEGPNGDKIDGIDFSAMNAYMNDVIRVINRDGSLIARVFPPEADVLLFFTERIANDVVSDYITILLSEAQNLQQPLFLLATAATFGQVYRLVDVVVAIEPKNAIVTKERAEDVVFSMFEPHMDDYLQEEGEWIREVLEGLCREWDQKTASDLALADPTFLASSNPALVKRNVLAGFTKVLLLPVTIIPKTASMGFNALTFGATEAFNTITSLTGSSHAQPVVAPPQASLAEIEPQNQWSAQVAAASAPEPSPTASSSASRPTGHFDRLQLLLSLDVALQLIQANRDCLKRVQTFIRYPGTYGRKVRDAIEEIFIILLQTLGEKHVVPGFAKATSQMNAYKPAEHDHDADEGGDGGAVAPLVQFFELVHIGDTIQQMVDVYYEKEMATYIDKRDFLNAVVREKKRFETSLDDAVAQGLNAGVNILLNQVEHLVQTRQGPQDFCPPEGADIDLQPTKACKDTIETLMTHCNMLKGSTDKQILEVFHSEVGIRLHGILLKHIKRLIVSIEGGFQLIADLNAYHSFILSLRQPAITSYFTSLKMVGEIFIIDSPKDLSHLVRDVSRYEGTLSTEDLYEIVQRRADWKKIEKEVERGLFGFKKEDCIIA